MVKKSTINLDLKQMAECGSSKLSKQLRNT